MGGGVPTDTFLHTLIILWNSLVSATPMQKLYLKTGHRRVLLILSSSYFTTTQNYDAQWPVSFRSLAIAVTRQI
jgi:hypothetical protein